MEIVCGLLVGVGLSAACGFRLFVPLLGMSIAARAGHLELSSGFDWIGSTPALLALATATVLEIGAYYVPWLDNLLDAAATPAAVVAGTIITASQLGEMSPWLKWSAAAIAGGGSSGVVQGGTTAIRAASTGFTAGLANPLVSTLEWCASLLMTLLAIIVPVLAATVAAVVCFLIVRKLLQLRPRPATKTPHDDRSGQGATMP